MNNSSESETLLEAQRNVYINDWSPNDQFLVYTQASAENAFDLWYLPLADNSKPVAFLASPFNEFLGQVSPDGKWIAYGDSGPNEI